MTDVMPDTVVQVLDKGFLALDGALASDLAVVNDLTQQGCDLIRWILDDERI